MPNAGLKGLHSAALHGSSLTGNLEQVGFIMRVEGQPLTADLEDYLPDFKFAFEGVGEEAGGHYYTSNRSQELNDRFGDLLHKIRDLEVSLHW